jgi:cytochrome b6-f complex iron-sulfur subunit
MKSSEQKSEAPGAAVEKPASKKRSARSETRGHVARRKFVWASVFGFLGACTAATVRFFYPRALFEPKTRFAIGYPSDFNFGVSTKFQQSNRIWVVRDSSSIYVMFARCTHLGCTPDWKEAENKFKCPCHGSGFDTEGINFEGPAPRPLARVHVEMDAEGQIVVDTARLYGADQWKVSGAFLPA